LKFFINHLSDLSKYIEKMIYIFNIFTNQTETKMDELQRLQREKRELETKIQNIKGKEFDKHLLKFMPKVESGLWLVKFEDECMCHPCDNYVVLRVEHDFYSNVCDFNTLQVEMNNAEAEIEAVIRYGRIFNSPHGRMFTTVEDNKKPSALHIGWKSKDDEDEDEDEYIYYRILSIKNLTQDNKYS